MPTPGAALELWAGVECTVNRTGDRWTDQLVRSGHDARRDDLDRLAALGVRTVRYPVLWERVTPHVDDVPDWRWSDERLAHLRALGIRPIVGLLHHGSGPAGTSLDDPAFPARLARFARLVAERYPWVDAYTPVNEPLTTARFSGLYGLWYPHARDDGAFARIVVAQCVATALAMRAIRQVRPDAILVQTEDLGRTHATMRLAYQARFENMRRWATWDLLDGRVDRTHPFRDYVRWADRTGVADALCDRLCDAPVPPDVIGVNHYLTSERFLDHRLDRYPAALHGGNGRDRYVDVEAVRVDACATAGPAALLREAWTRYRRPVVVTEAHLGCTREQQLRWLRDVWEGAHAARAAGADVRAVTTWSAFGAFDWASLLTRDEGCYEPGAFDVRAPAPRPTAVAQMARALATTGRYDHPALDVEGWWHCDGRLVFVPDPAAPEHAFLRPRAGTTPRPLLVTGARGTLGHATLRLCAARGLAAHGTTRDTLDVADPAAVAEQLDALRPWAVINCAGYVRVDDAEWDVDGCYRDNRDAAAVLARACAQRGIPLVTFSSDLVFDGEQRIPYVERDRPAPLGVYGASKAVAEADVLAVHPGALVVRTSAFFGPWDDANVVTLALRALADGLPWPAADDAIVSPTYVPDLVHAVLDLLLDGEHGVWHLANDGAVSWADLVRRAAALAGLDAALVQGRPIDALALPARRPRWSVLGSERGALMPSLDDALARYLTARPEPADRADDVVVTA